MIAEFFSILSATVIGYLIGYLLAFGFLSLVGASTRFLRDTFWLGIAVSFALAVWGALGGEPPLKMLLERVGVL